MRQKKNKKSITATIKRYAKVAAVIVGLFAGATRPADPAPSMIQNPACVSHCTIETSKR